MRKMIRNVLQQNSKRNTLVNVVARSIRLNTVSQQEQSARTASEVNHHENLADIWWQKEGPVAPLHALNELRVPFIRDGLLHRGPQKPRAVEATSSGLSGTRLLEVGCGAGILTEDLGRLGADVTGIDLGEDLISTARNHLNVHSPELLPRLRYIAEPLEKHIQSHVEVYDGVIISEVLEHVDDKSEFLKSTLQALKPGGSLFITTLSKTVPMWIFAIAFCEYVMKVIPIGTHHWDKLISPKDLQRILDSLNCETVFLNGSSYNAWRNKWSWINSTQLFYALQAVKK